MTNLSVAEVGERWPEALVIWDRDVAQEGWAPMFRVTPTGELSAVHRAGGMGRCHHGGWCECSIQARRWTGERWIPSADADHLDDGT